MHVFGVELPLLRTAQAVVNRGLALGRGVLVHQTGAQQHLGTAERCKIRCIQLVVLGQTEAGKIPRQRIQRRTAGHCRAERRCQQRQSAAEALAKRVHTACIRPRQRQRGLCHGQRVEIPLPERRLCGLHLPILPERLGLQSDNAEAQRQKPRYMVPAAHAAVQVVVHQQQRMHAVRGGADDPGRDAAPVKRDGQPLIHAAGVAERDGRTAYRGVQCRRSLLPALRKISGGLSLPGVAVQKCLLLGDGHSTASLLVKKSSSISSNSGISSCP